MEKSSSSSRTLEFTVLSGENLRVNRRSVKKNTFVVVKTDPFDWFTTKMDIQDGSYPSWNEKLVIELPLHARFITVQVQYKTSSGNIKTIGSVNIPVSDFIGGFVPENYLHFLSYRLRDPNGEKCGIINISVRVVNKEPRRDTCSSKTGWNVPAGYPTCSSEIGGLRVSGYATWTSEEAVGVPVGPVGRVVTGVPVWSQNHA